MADEFADFRRRILTDRLKDVLHQCIELDSVPFHEYETEIVVRGERLRVVVRVDKAND